MKVDGQFVLIIVEFYCNGTQSVTVFDGVVEQIGEKLFQCFWITYDREIGREIGPVDLDFDV